MHKSIGVSVVACALAAIASSCGGGSGSGAQPGTAATQYQQVTKVSVPEAAAPSANKTVATATPEAVNALMPELAQQAPAPATPAEPAPAAAPAPTPPPAPAPAQPPAPESHDANLAGNGGADAKDETGRPRGWMVNTPDIFAKSEGAAIEGSDFLALKSVKGRAGVIIVPVALKPEDAGKPLRVEAWGKTSAAESMTMSLAYKDGGKDKQESRTFWPKSPKAWSKLEFTAKVPASADLSTVGVMVTIPDKAGLTFALDGVRVTRDLLGPNASLELVDNDGRPRGWSSSDGFVTKDKVKPREGERALALKASTEMRGYIARTLELAKEDLGKKLVVSAWGQADSPDALAIEVLAGDKLIGQTSWPATKGEWKQRVLEVELSKDADSKTIQVRISVQQKAEGKYAVDMVQASVE